MIPLLRVRLRSSDDGQVILRWACEADGGLQMSAATAVRASQRDPLLQFFADMAQGRRAMFRADTGSLGLYADPRPDGTRLTLEWNGQTHATCGLTLSAEDVRNLLQHLSDDADVDEELR